MNLPSLHTALEMDISDDIFHKLVQQIDKDFVFSGITYDFTNLDPNQLVNALYEIVEHLLAKEYATFLNLLYRIDIPESKIEPTEAYTLEENVVILILKRQLLKVQLRMKYSS